MKLLYAEKTAIKLMQEHGLIQLGWKFKFFKHSSIFGLCDYANKLIKLSTELVALNNDVEVTDTILHEIAHALTPGDKHGKNWQNMCVHIGCRPVARFNESMAVSLKNKYVAVCIGCNKKYKNKLPIPVRCSCTNDSQTKFLLTWSQRQITV